MKLKAICAVLLAAVVLSLTSCNTMRRLGKDLYVAVPGLVSVVPMAACADSYRDATATQEGYQTGGVTQVLSFPLFMVWNTVKHLGYWGVHVVDIPMNLFYGISEASSFGPEIEPLDYYQATWFDKQENGSGTDAESGDTGR